MEDNDAIWLVSCLPCPSEGKEAVREGTVATVESEGSWNRCSSRLVSNAVAMAGRGTLLVLSGLIRPLSFVIRDTCRATGATASEGSAPSWRERGLALGYG